MIAAMLLRLAEASDVPALLELREQAAAWLWSRGSDQWQRPWPDRAGMVERVRAAVDDRQTWCVEQAGEVVATVSMSRDGAASLWSPAELAEPAVYVQRLIVARAVAGQGVGAELLDWVGTQAASRGDRWVRVDVWTSNTHLHTYYAHLGFRLLRILRSEYPSGALLERAARVRPTPRLRMLAGAADGLPVSRRA